MPEEYFHKVNSEPAENRISHNDDDIWDEKEEELNVDGTDWLLHLVALELLKFPYEEDKDKYVSHNDKWICKRQFVEYTS